MNADDETLFKAVAVASTDPRAALLILDEGIGKMRNGGDVRGLAKLAKFASATSSGLGEYERALSYCDEALRGTPDDSSLHMMRGLVLRSMRKTREAQSAFEHVLVLAEGQGDQEAIRTAQAALARIE